MKGLVYGDIIGSPFRIENTDSRFFEAGRSRSAQHDGRITVFHPHVTEATLGAGAAMAWLSAERDSPTAAGFRERLARTFNAHPGAPWSEHTRALLSSGAAGRSAFPNCCVLTRSVPVTEACTDRDTAITLSSLCAEATCSDPATVRAAGSAAALLWDARHAGGTLESMLEGYGIQASLYSDSDLRCELRGMERQPLEMLGQPIEGAFIYRESPEGSPVSPDVVLIAAARCTDRADGWEDAVRRAVSMGGPSATLAAVTGALAEVRFGEPRLESGMGEVIATVPVDMRERMESFDRMLRTRERSQGDTIRGSVRTEAQRRRNREAFSTLVSAVKDIQDELKEMAGLAGKPGQVRFKNAVYPFYDGQERSVALFRGSSILEKIALGDDGIIHVGASDTRTASVNTRSDLESLSESIQASRSILTRKTAADPAGRIEDVIASFRAAVLDESMEAPGEDGEKLHPLLGFSNSHSLDRDIAWGFLSHSPMGFESDVRGTGRRHAGTTTIYTVGFGNRTLREYTDLVALLGVDTVVDIRSAQTSPRRPQFRSESIDDALFDLGIDYLDGSATMGPRQEGFLDAHGRTDWQAMRMSDGYRKSIQGIADLMRSGHTVAVTSSEGSPLTSHRLATVSRDLHGMGANVVHVMRNGCVLRHEEVEAMLISRYAGRCLIDGRKMYDDQLEDAYRLLNQERGWKREQRQGRRRGHGR